MTIMKAQNLPEHFPPSVILLLVTLQNVTITKIILQSYKNFVLRSQIQN